MPFSIGDRHRTAKREVTKMSGRMDPRKQFSKWLARYGAIFWGAYLVIIAVLILAQPEAAMACVWLALIVTVNKMLDTWAYTKNSTYEKGLLAMLERTKMELRLGSKADKEEVQTGEEIYDEEHEEEEVSNG